MHSAKPQVKICGLTNASDVESVAALTPDAIGFVCWPKSKRAVTPAQVGAWTSGLPDSIQKVGIFVDATADELRQARAEAGFDILQLHGAEFPAFVNQLGLPTWKALHLQEIAIEWQNTLSDLPSRGNPPPGFLQAFLIDSGNASNPGGTGITSDWDRAAEFVISSPRPVWLAGGLDPMNVRLAMEKVQPFGVDVSSGVEASPGKKDLARVRDFIEQVRA